MPTVIALYRVWSARSGFIWNHSLVTIPYLVSLHDICVRTQLAAYSAVFGRCGITLVLDHECVIKSWSHVVRNMRFILWLKMLSVATLEKLLFM